MKITFDMGKDEWNYFCKNLMEHCTNHKETTENFRGLGLFMADIRHTLKKLLKMDQPEPLVGHPTEEDSK